MDPKIAAVILDWAGTAVDHGSLAPVGVFVELFAREGVAVTLEQARGPMGVHKREHIRQVARLPEVTATTLSGGAKALILTRPEIPLVAVSARVVWPEGATATGDAQRDGWLLSALLGTGTTARDGEALESALDRLGALWGLSFSAEGLAIELEVPLGGEDEALALLAEAVFQADFRRREVRRVSRDWRDGYAVVPYDIRELHDRAVNHLIVPADHPHRSWDIAGDQRGLRVGRAETLLADVVRRGQAFVSVVGPLGEADAVALVERHLGGLAGR